MVRHNLTVKIYWLWKLLKDLRVDYLLVFQINRRRIKYQFVRQTIMSKDENASTIKKLTDFKGLADALGCRRLG